MGQNENKLRLQFKDSLLIDRMMAIYNVIPLHHKPHPAVLIFKACKVLDEIKNLFRPTNYTADFKIWQKQVFLFAQVNATCCAGAALQFMLRGDNV